MKTPIFTGACTAIVTPYRGYEVDYDVLGKLIEDQYKGGISALVVCGTTGENATQPIAEHQKVVDYCVEKTAGRMKIIAGVGSNDTMTSITLAKSAKESGVDGVLMVTPYYNKTTQKGLVAHFSTVADTVDVPLILYNVPSRTGVGLTAETYEILSKHPNINGAKEASADFSLFSRTVALCGDNLNIWSGNDDNTVPMMSMGAKGVISVASNIVPEAVTKLCNLCFENKFQEATALYCKYSELFANLFIEVNPIPVKTAMNLMGMNVGDFRLPLVSMGEANLEKLKKSMRDLSLI